MTQTTQCPTTWYTDGPDEGHGVSPADEPHQCELLAGDVHAKCRCDCGAETQRPAGDREVARHEARAGKASLSVDGRGSGRLTVGGVDISKAVSAGSLEFNAGHGTVIKVELPLAAAMARGEVELNEDTAKALEALGWVSPSQIREVALEASNKTRRDLQEALGGLGTVLRGWSDLLEIVRQMATVDECMISNARALVALAVLLDLPATADTEQIEAKVRELQAKAGEQP